VQPRLQRTGLAGRDLGILERVYEHRKPLVLLEDVMKAAVRCSSELGRRGDVPLQFRDVLPFRPS